MASTIQSVQTFGRKKTAVAVAYCKQSKEGKGLIKLNGSPIEHVKPEELKLKVLEPILLLGKDRCGRMAHSSRARSCARALRGGAGARGGGCRPWPWPWPGRRETRESALVRDAAPPSADAHR